MKNYIANNDPLELTFGRDETEQRTISSSFVVPKMRSNAPSLLSGVPPKRQKSSSQISTDSLKSADENSAAPTTATSTNRPSTNATCYKTTSLPESFGRRLCKKHPLKCINYSRTHIVRVYPAGFRIESSNFNPLTFWQFGMQVRIAFPNKMYIHF
jgi:phosphatidylinositol phospholipase C epsilon